MTVSPTIQWTLSAIQVNACPQLAQLRAFQALVSDGEPRGITLVLHIGMVRLLREWAARLLMVNESSSANAQK